jgi:ABC-type Na+ transport system ATPase subunit NatA
MFTVALHSAVEPDIFSLALVRLCDSFILIRKNLTVLLFTHEQIVERQVLGKPNQSWLLVDTQS